MYSIKDLASEVKKTEQSIRNLIKNNAEFAMITEANISKHGRFVKYGEPVLCWLLKYYGIAQEADKEEESTEEQGETSPEAAGADFSGVDIEALQGEVEELKREIEKLMAALDKAEGERMELLKQNGILALTLQQVQQEKMMYLPKPDDRKTLGQKLRELFGK